MSAAQASGQAPAPNGAAPRDQLTAAPSSRLTWLDLFRGACVLGMIETHVLNTFLATAIREESWFLWLNYLNGLIAPGFLFIAGYTQGIGTQLASRKPRIWGRRVRRLVSVWLLGYALHFPLPQLVAGQWAEAYRIGTQVDVLQCLTVSLVLLLAGERFARRWIYALAALGIVVFVFALREEVAAAWSFSPDWLLAYFNRSTGSLFPLIPWLGFVFAGFLVSAPRSVAMRIAVWVIAVVLAFLTHGSVSFFFERLASLLALVPLVQWVAARWDLRWLIAAGRESLVMYAAHLVLIEVAATILLTRKAYALPMCLGLFAVVLGVTVAVTIGWRRVQDSRTPAR